MTILKRLLLAAAVVLSTQAASAQYYEIANQLTNLISPALSGAGSYRGYIELSGLPGLGTNRANFAEISTSQGFRYNSWFYMGAGLGVDVVRSTVDELVLGERSTGHSLAQTKCMVPVFSDFRFFIGPDSGLSAYIDLKLGAAWLIGSGYLQLNEGYLTGGTQFYLKPSVGVRIPVRKGDTKHAFNAGLTYQLLTSNNSWLVGNGNATLNNIGITLAYEW
ncbi:MAG: hypothetical protein K2L21_03030 [Muribaculaceae bacterium]|nr:hypothetical protein [Muribaculaceae bacterium]